MNNGDRPGALQDIRVLDLTDALGVYCAKLLADLGADVIKVEPPQGAPGRGRGPFHHDGPHPDGSLWFIHFNAGKRGVTLDLDTPEGQVLLKRLATDADVLVEDAAPGVMTDRGLGYHDLRRLNPRLVYTSVTPYGQAGPYSGYTGSDLTAQAMGGLMYRVGWPEDPPSALGASFAYQHTAAIAAVGTLMALVGRDASGQGQHVDAAMHDSIAMVQYDAMPRHAATGQAIRRAGPGQGVGGRRNTRIWPCEDGHVRFQLLGATAIPEWPRLLDWLDEHGMAEDLRDPRWVEMEARQQELAHVEAVVDRFFRPRTRLHLMEEGQSRGIMVMACNTVEDLPSDPQLLHGDYFASVECPQMGEALTDAGAPYRLSETPWRIRRPPPRLGESNRELFGGELGLSQEEIEELHQKGAV